MPRFHYQALNADEQLVAGDVDAATVQEAIAQLESRGLVVQSIGIASARAEAAEVALQIVPEAAIAEQQMARVLQEARPLVPALRAYAEEMTARPRRRELLAVCSLLESGDAASALERWRRLPEYWIPLLAAAAATNDPARVLREFLDEAERAHDLRVQWRRMLAYPVVVVLLALAVLLFLSLAVLPIFRDMFADFALQLPDLTRGVLGLGWFLTSRVGLVVAVIVVAVVAVLAMRRWLLPARANSRFTDWYDKRFRRSAVISRFARFAAELIQAGVEPTAAMRLAAQTTRLPEPSAPAPASSAGPLNYAELVKSKFARPISATIAYATSRDMLPATRARLLKEVSNCFADQSRRRASVMQGLFGPLAVCFVGGCVLLVVLALFLPLVELINNLSG